MDRLLVIFITYLKKLDKLIVLICIVGLIILNYMYGYVMENKSSSFFINVESSDPISRDYNLDINYYLLYDDIIIDNITEKYNVKYDPFSQYEIVMGRDVRNDFEVLVSSKYKTLLNRNIFIKIDDETYYFKVVGIYHSDGFITDNNLYINEKTRNIIRQRNFNSKYPYHYLFEVDNLKELNNNLDLLVNHDYEIYVGPSNSLVKLEEFSSRIDAIILADVILLTITFIFIIYDVCEGN